MPRTRKDLHPLKRELLQDGCVIPAHPLALDYQRKLDKRHQRALTKYYVSAGAGGVAVGVHTTQFAIRRHGIYCDVLGLAVEAIEEMGVNRPIIKIAGVCGPTDRAVKEAEIAAEFGYDAVIMCPYGEETMSEEELIECAQVLSEILPIFGFYLQPSVGGRTLSFNFWRRMADIDNLVAIKIAPFNRYETLKVVRAVASSRRHQEIALYTGNDDNIVFDLLTNFRFEVNGEKITKKIVGGLLGQFAVWTKFAVEILDLIKSFSKKPEKSNSTYQYLLQLAAELTDANAAIFDTYNNFKGVIPGINEILRRQGLMRTRLTLDPNEDLSNGQLEEIERILKSYPHLHVIDDEFIKNNLRDWLD